MYASLLRNRAFYTTLLRIAIPITIQQCVISASNAADTLMVGQLGDTAVAAMGLANQVFFLLNLLVFGIGSGAAIFAAQFWGQRDVTNIRKILGISLTLSVAGGTLFTFVSIAYPAWTLGLYTNDPAVIAIGADYLRIVALTYVPYAITTVFAAIIRTSEEVHLPMQAAVIALTIKVVLGYALIFGYLGFPALGVIGAAIATNVGRVIELAILLAVAYRRKLPAAASLKELVPSDRALWNSYIRTGLPVIVGEVTWSMGITTYNLIYARISTESIAAVSIASTIENLAFVAFIGMTSSSSIMIGNRIGASQEHAALSYARRFLILSVLGGLVVGGIVFVVTPWIVSFYKVSGLTQVYTRNVLFVLAGILWLKVTNFMMIVGLLRTGGDTRYAFLADSGSIWFVGIPMALLGAFVFHLPVYWVALMAAADEMVKFAAAMWRVARRQWANSIILPAQQPVSDLE